MTISPTGLLMSICGEHRGYQKEHVPAATTQIKTAESMPTVTTQTKTAESVPTVTTQTKTTESMPTVTTQIKTTESMPTVTTQIKTTESMPTVTTQIKTTESGRGYTYARKIVGQCATRGVAGQSVENYVSYKAGHDWLVTARKARQILETSHGVGEYVSTKALLLNARNFNVTHKLAALPVVLDNVDSKNSEPAASRSGNNAGAAAHSLDPRLISFEEVRRIEAEAWVALEQSCRQEASFLINAQEKYASFADIVTETAAVPLTPSSRACLFYETENALVKDLQERKIPKETLQQAKFYCQAMALRDQEVGKVLTAFEHMMKSQFT
jgi:hypothetical protein